MKKIMIIIITLVSGTMYSQGFVNPSIIPPSPEAAAFAKHIETPVSPFNGTASVSIPIYQISQGDISIPITLSYHTGGIKVSEEASWVGLGWSLQAGGQITRVIKGKDDHRGPKDFKNKCFPSPFGMQDTSGGQYHTLFPAFYNQNGQLENIYDEFSANLGNVDGEADLYMYNFGQYSGKFVVDNNTVYDISENSIVFEYSPSSITATTPEGIVYIFDSKEQTRDSYAYTSTYYLSQIHTPSDPQNPIIFSYKSYQDLKSELGAFTNVSGWAQQLPMINQQYTSSNATVSNPTGFQESFSTHSINTLYLDKIEFKNGRVEFEKFARSDLYGFGLNKIKVYPNTSIQSIKEIVFDHGYFTGDFSYGGDYLADVNTTFPIDFRRKRLQLLGLIDQTDPTEPKEHRFYYNEQEQLPYKTSIAVDYWGYANDAYGNDNLIPDYRRYVSIARIPTVLQSWQGADREPDFDRAVLGSLRRIQYPTGGTTDIEYEMHTYTNLKDVSLPNGQKYIRTTVSAVDYNEGNNGGFVEAEFEIEPPSPGAEDQIPPVDIDVALFCNGESICPTNCGTATGGTGINNKQYAYLYVLDNGNWVRLFGDSWDGARQEIYDCNDGNPRMHYYSRNLPEGRYKIRVNYPDHLEGAINGPVKHSRMSIAYYKLEDGNQQVDSGIGGGLRVSKVTTTATDTGTVSEKKYRYSEGVMTRFPIFYYYEGLTVSRYANNPLNPSLWHKDYCGFAYLYSNTIVPYSASANGSIVGYKKVEEITNNREEGWSIYEYHVEPDQINFILHNVVNFPLTDGAYISPSYLPGTPSTPNLMNGKVKSISYYGGEYGGPAARLIKKEEYFYNILAHKAFLNFKYKSNFHGLPRPEDGYLYRYSTYPLLIGKTVSTTQRNTYNHFQLDYPQRLENNQVVEEINTYYNSNDHLFPTRTEKSSTEDEHMYYNSLYIYPQDYTAGNAMLNDLVASNIVNRPIETVNYVKKGYGQGAVSEVTNAGITTLKKANENGFGKPFQTFILEPEDPVRLSDYQFSNQNTAGQDPFTGNSRRTLSTSVIDDNYSAMPEGTLHYTTVGNLSEVDLKEKKQIVYIWGYNDTYPIAKIEGVDHTAVQTYIQDVKDASNQDTDHCTAANCKEQQLREALQQLRIDLPEAMITSYTYDPLIGMTSQTDSKGYTTFYEHDQYNRLKQIKDAEGNIVSQHTYNYKNQ